MNLTLEEKAAAALCPGSTSTQRAWLAEPAAAAAPRTAVGESHGTFADPESQIVLGDFPLTALTAFPGLGLSDPVLAHAVRLSKEV